MAQIQYDVSQVVSAAQLKVLKPYLIGERARDDGEWDMFCPLHDDIEKRSAQLNVMRGVWYCHACDKGGSVADLLAERDSWVNPPPGAARRRAAEKRPRSGSQPREEITEARVRMWARELQSEDARREELLSARGLFNKTILDYEIGWDHVKRAYTIPVRSPEGEFWNVRRYQLNPAEGRRKMWGIEGMNQPRLYPIQALRTEPGAPIIVCEGEWDALITNQHGFAAVTRTASAKTWTTAWNEWFQDRIVYLCHDADRAGQEANQKVGAALAGVADVRVVQLPYPTEEKHGKDLTDWWIDHDGDADAFRRLLEEAVPLGDEEPTHEPADVSVVDSFDSRRVGKPLRLTVTIKGKRDPGYSIPRKVRYRCTRDKGKICAICPLNATGDDTKIISGTDPRILEMMDATRRQLMEPLRLAYGIPKCDRVTIDIEEHQAVEILFARPSVDHANGNGGDYKNIKLTSVGRHDTSPNNTVHVVGALHPDPRKQLNEFLAWDVSRLETSLDHFEMDARTAKLMRRFRPAEGMRPLKKLRRIADDLAEHVTHIYGRPEMHALIDLVFHSAMAFDFAGKRVHKGWLDALIVGDTRTGKSEAADRLSKHFKAGEVVSCESATYAGIVGGLQQYGQSKEWAITWGAIPINDRRLVVLDEVSGLEPEEIAQMSSVRSSGTAELTKIQQERTYARTRLLWLGNPRNAKMSDYTYDVQAVPPLIGNAEDIARFDLAMSVRAGEVPASEINRIHDETKQRYSSEACSLLLRWVWSRTPDQIVWAEGAESAVLAAANKLGGRYVEEPPLIQAANVREKVARIAVALAARLFSTDESMERIVVTQEHVDDAVAFIDRLYSMGKFGYAQRSAELIADAAEARERAQEIKQYLYNLPALAKFLRGASKFRRQDVEEVLDCDRDYANTIISTLWKARMVRKDKGDVRVNGVLHDILREVNL